MPKLLPTPTCAPRPAAPGCPAGAPRRSGPAAAGPGEVFGLEAGQEGGEQEFLFYGFFAYAVECPPLAVPGSTHTPRHGIGDRFTKGSALPFHFSYIRPAPHLGQSLDRAVRQGHLPIGVRALLLLLPHQPPYPTLCLTLSFRCRSRNGAEGRTAPRQVRRNRPGPLLHPPRPLPHPNPCPLPHPNPCPLPHPNPCPYPTLSSSGVPLRLLTANGLVTARAGKDGRGEGQGATSPSHCCVCLMRPSHRPRCKPPFLSTPYRRPYGTNRVRHPRQQPTTTQSACDRHTCTSTPCRSASGSATWCNKPFLHVPHPQPATDRCLPCQLRTL